MKKLVSLCVCSILMTGLLLSQESFAQRREGRNNRRFEAERRDQKQLDARQAERDVERMGRVASRANMEAPQLEATLETATQRMRDLAPEARREEYVRENDTARSEVLTEAEKSPAALEYMLSLAEAHASARSTSREAEGEQLVDWVQARKRILGEKQSDGSYKDAWTGEALLAGARLNRSVAERARAKDISPERALAEILNEAGMLARYRRECR